MIDKYLYGDEKRLFLNTNLGCSAKCFYCYLPKLDLSIGTTPNQTMDIKKLVSLLKQHPSFVQGKDGTILSLGCYSECWDKINRDDTIALVNKLLKFGNPIQMATKEYIEEQDFCKLNLAKISYLHHFSLFISSSTIR